MAVYSIDLEECTECGHCYINCPEDAICANEDGRFFIDSSVCSGCGHCYEACPITCIREEEAGDRRDVQCPEQSY